MIMKSGYSLWSRLFPIFVLVVVCLLVGSIHFYVSQLPELFKVLLKYALIYLILDLNILYCLTKMYSPTILNLKLVKINAEHGPLEIVPIEFL